MLLAFCSKLIDITISINLFHGINVLFYSEVKAAIVKLMVEMFFNFF